MKSSLSFVFAVAVCSALMLCGFGGMSLEAAETEDIAIEVTEEATFPEDEDTILKGIFIGDVEVGGLTKEEAENAIAVYLQGIKAKSFVLQIEDALGSGEQSIKLSDMSVIWANPEVIEEAANLAQKGNIIRRYKERKDLENNHKEFMIKLRVDKNTLVALLKERLAEFERSAVNASISLPGKNAEFVITESRDGRIVLYEDTAVSLVDFIENEWGFEDGVEFQVLTEITPAAYNTELVKLIGREGMGRFYTTFKSSSEERSANIANAASKINGVVVYPGQEFSTLAHIAPFTVENGYFEAGSYFGGKLTDSVGGGVCQVASTLYNAVLQAELEVTKRSNHGLTVDYVQLSADAAVAESSGMDFCFKNNTQVPVLLSAYVENKTLVIELYGYDTRSEARTIKYVHEVLEEYEPGEDIYEDDPELPVGTTEVKQKAHKGYKAVLYKNVYLNGSLTEHVKVNESVYKAAPKYIAVGTKQPEE